MTLDSSASLSTAWGTNDIGQVGPTHPEREICPSADSWCYLFMHWARVPLFIRATSMYFRCFVHKTKYTYAHSKKDCGEILKPTISGLVFIQGSAPNIHTYLKQEFPELHLAKDCASGQTAVIPDSVMEPFMKVAEHDPTRIRILRHPLEHYAQGHTPVRFTSGLLKGCEGYIIRIERDRKLVMQIGAITLAIGNIHKEQFENIDDPAVDAEVWK